MGFNFQETSTHVRSGQVRDLSLLPMFETRSFLRILKHRLAYVTRFKNMWTLLMHRRIGVFPDSRSRIAEQLPGGFLHFGRLL